MSFPRYPKYKPSGVEWLGEVPAEWRCAPLWSLFRRVKRTGAGGEVLLSVYRDHGVVPKDSRADNFNKPSEDLGLYQLVEVGDLVINKMKAWQGSVAISPCRGIVSPAYFTFVGQHNENSAFLHYLMRSAPYIGTYFAGSKGIRVNQWDLEPSEHRRTPVLLPPRGDQDAIARFLERESERIDELVAEQERLIELLKEKRQAVISHAVTKGLNPDAPMKPSGIEWFGDVPAHWAVYAIKRDVEFITSGSRGWADRYSDEGELFVRIANLTRDSIRLDLTDVQRVVVSQSQESERTRLRAGDLLVSITADLGSVAVCPSGIEAAYISQHVALVRLLSGRLSSEWAAHAALSSAGKAWFAVRGYGGTKVQLSLDDVLTMPLAIPPLEEQQLILSQLDAALSAYEVLMEEATVAITLLRERRSALISAAVTGQIDVRNTVPKEAVL